MTFPTQDEAWSQARSSMLNPGMRTPAWLVLAVLLGAAALVVPVFGLNELATSRAATFTISVYFLVAGFIAFNFEPRFARIYVLLVWGFAGAGIWLGGHGGETDSWLIVGLAGLVGAEVLSRGCRSVRFAAVTDPLTGLYNRIGLVDESERAITICRRLGQPLSLVHIDLDGFKQVNDSQGHARGDRILRQCADNWAGVIRPGDILARVGGDEFLLVLPGSNSSEARGLVGALKEVSPIGWSYGVAELAPAEGLQAGVDRADAELRLQKFASESDPDGSGEPPSPAGRTGGRADRE